MRKVLNLLYENISLIFFGIIITYLCVTSFFNTCYISIDYREHTFFVSDKPLRNMLFVVIFLIGIYCLKKSKLPNIINNNKKLFLIIKYVLLSIIFILGLVWVLNTRFFPAADQYSMQKCVSEFLNNDYSSAVSNGYLNKNFQQRGLFMLSYLFALVFGDMNIIAIQILNVIAVVFIFKSLSEIIGIYKGSYLMQIIVILSGIIFPIILLYSYFIYGNIIGLSFALLAIKYELLFFDNKIINHGILSSLMIFMAILCKSNYQIYFIAMLICLFFNLINKYDIKKIIYLVLLIVALLLSSILPTSFIENKTSTKMSEGLSFYSYVAMGLQESERAPGWYNGFNHDSYAECDNNTAKHKEYSKKAIDERIELFKADLDYADEFLSKKISSEWNNPTYQVFWNIQDKFDSDFKPSPFVLNFVSLDNTFVIQKYLNIIDSIIKFGALLYVGYLIFNKERESLLLPVTFIGGFLFLSFLSEAKAQYTIMFSSLLIPMAALGYSYFVDLIINKNIKCSIVEKIKMILLVILVVLTCVSVNNKKYLSKDTDFYYEYTSQGESFDYSIMPEYLE